MSLSSDRLNGHPNVKDPNPGKRAEITRAQNGWPSARRAAEKKAKAGTPAEQKRRVDLAAKNRQRAIMKQRNLKMLEIYGIPEPLTVPGEKKLFSRWLKEKKDRRTRFENLAEFCLYIMKNYGDEEKDDQWRAFLAAADPEGDAEEKAAEETQAALTAIDTQTTSVPALDASELPAETFHEEL